MKKVMIWIFRIIALPFVAVLGSVALIIHGIRYWTSEEYRKREKDAGSKRALDTILQREE